MLKSTIDKIHNAINGIYNYSCWCCMNKKDKAAYRRHLRSRLKSDLRKEVREELTE